MGQRKGPADNFNRIWHLEVMTHTYVKVIRELHANKLQTGGETFQSK